MASYPTSVYSATTKNPGDTIQSASINNLDAEIAAIESALTGGTGLAHDLKFVDATYDIGKSGATRPRDFFLSRNATIGGTLGVTGNLTLSGTGNAVGTITSGVWNAGAVTSSGLLTVNGYGAHDFTAGGAGEQNLRLTNTSAGAAAGARVYISGDQGVGNGLNLMQFSSTYTTSTFLVQNGGALWEASAGGLSIAANHASGAIRFYSGGTTLRWTINTLGSLVAGTVGVGNSYTEIYTGGGQISISNPGTGAANAILFGNANGTVGTIATNGTATAYNTSSDQRLKTDRGLASDVARLLALEIHDFDWLSNGTRDRGVFAQQVRGYPQAITVGTDERTAEGHLVKPWMTDYSKFVPDLIVGWQQHEARLAALEAKGR